MKGDATFSLLRMNWMNEVYQGQSVLWKRSKNLWGNNGGTRRKSREDAPSVWVFIYSLLAAWRRRTTGELLFTGMVLWERIARLFWGGGNSTLHVRTDTFFHSEFTKTALHIIISLVTSSDCLSLEQQRPSGCHWDVLSSKVTVIFSHPWECIRGRQEDQMAKWWNQRQSSELRARSPRLRWPRLPPLKCGPHWSWFCFTSCYSNRPSLLACDCLTKPPIPPTPHRPRPAITQTTATSECKGLRRAASLLCLSSRFSQDEARVLGTWKT